MRLTIRTALWRGHVARTAGAVDGLVPVVKGNGYGFGRRWLATTAAEFADTIAVGTVHELADVPRGITAVVLTPTLAAPDTNDPILTVGNRHHVDALAAWHGRVIVKLASTMQRYGRTAALVADARRAGLEVVGVSLHPPLAGSPAEHAGEITAAVADLDPKLEVWISHLDPTAFTTLPSTHEFRLRLGTLLWHGDKTMLQLSADVLDVRPVRAGDRAGYRLHTVEATGHLVMVGAGSAHGVVALPDGRSPFHFRRRRLDLLEPPHMHTSMCVVRDGDALPAIGDRVDVQRPLTMTIVDEYEWI